MNNQPWFCPECGVAGFVRYEDGAGVMEVMRKIGADHRRLSPCSTGDLGLKVINNDALERTAEREKKLRDTVARLRGDLLEARTPKPKPYVPMEEPFMACKCCGVKLELHEAAFVAACQGCALAKPGARVKRLEAVLRELVEVATLRGDNDLPHPMNDPKLWTARMQDAWDAGCLGCRWITCPTSRSARRWRLLWRLAVMFDTSRNSFAGSIGTLGQIGRERSREEKNEATIGRLLRLLGKANNHLRRTASPLREEIAAERERAMRERCPIHGKET